MKKNKNLIFILLILALLILPFIVANQGEFGGTDQIALDVVMEIDPNYQPIADNIFVPASGEIESMLFTLQGVIGASFIGYFIGTKRAAYKSKHSAG
ncbi:MAG: energy-coupling factor ABC transporter substrate-binding protein [Firmicutes bacterium HGW-Firmicutes-1]|jgi:cobalt/nickel transport protein|nr:MAG: energy-coupling factor ABC transporter substrate-binding protein [Firmicutes bacterium HGW-Firmicutes-1]